MIYPGTVLNSIDNSGAKKLICIGIVFCKRSYGVLGDIIKVSVKTCSGRSRVKKGSVYNAIIVNTKYGIRRIGGFYLKFNSNSVILLDSKYNFIFTRILGSIPREFKHSEFSKIISMSKYVV